MAYKYLVARISSPYINQPPIKATTRDESSFPPSGSTTTLPEHSHMKRGGMLALPLEGINVTATAAAVVAVTVTATAAAVACGKSIPAILTETDRGSPMAGAQC